MKHARDRAKRALQRRRAHLERREAGAGEIDPPRNVGRGGALRVGPQSAGADPGPACYGKGELPCVTDAHVVLGRLPRTDPLGGQVHLQPERSERSLQTLAEAFGVSRRRLAEVALEVADAAMERALKAITLERGHGLMYVPMVIGLRRTRLDLEKSDARLAVETLAVLRRAARGASA